MINNGTNTQLVIWIQGHEILLILIVLWSIFWAGLALWNSARRSQFWWFIIFLIVHTFGVLEIIYLFGVLKLKLPELFRK